MTKEISKKQYVDSINKSGSKLIAEIEKQCEEDKSMANLKGKVKEIQKIMEA
jgi:phosphosulfolactate synthase (CoM biosynthesis protein A)